MKPLINLLRPATLAALFALTLSTTTLAQKRSVPEPSRIGYWVVETTKQPLRQTVVRFYSNSHELIYQEDLAKKRLNIHRAKTVGRLNLALSQVMTQWAMTKQFQPDQNLVAAQFRK